MEPPSLQRFEGLAKLAPCQGSSIDHDVIRVALGERFMSHEPAVHLVAGHQRPATVWVRFQKRDRTDLGHGTFTHIGEQLINILVVGAEHSEFVPRDKVKACFDKFDRDPGRHS